jgi:AcrR family transcriptional regulator
MQITNKPTDRRSLRTRRLLKEALFELILEKGYDAVKIEDITERADLGRTTFYLHYRDKEELLLESIDSIAEELLTRINLPDLNQTDADIAGLVQGAIIISFQHAYENAQLYRVILRGEGASSVSGRLHTIISQTALNILTARTKAGVLPPNPPVSLEVFANYFAGSLLALITWWLEEGAAISPDNMAVMFDRLFFAGGRSALTVE